MRHTLKALQPRLLRCAEITDTHPRDIRRLALTALIRHIEEHGTIPLPVCIEPQERPGAGTPRAEDDGPAEREPAPPERAPGPLCLKPGQARRMAFMARLLEMEPQDFLSLFIDPLLANLEETKHGLMEEICEGNEWLDFPSEEQRTRVQRRVNGWLKRRATRRAPHGRCSPAEV